MPAALDLARRATNVGDQDFRATATTVAPPYFGMHTLTYGSYGDTITVAAFTNSRPHVLISSTSGREGFCFIPANNFLGPTGTDAAYDFQDPFNGSNSAYDVFRVMGGTLTGSGAASSMTTFFKVQRNGSITTLGDLSVTGKRIQVPVNFSVGGLTNLTAANLTSVVVTGSHLQLVSASGGAFTIHGIAAGTPGQILYLTNLTNTTMTIANESGTEGTGANRLRTFTGSNQTSQLGSSGVTLIYTDRWCVV